MARDLVFVCYSREDQEWLDQLTPYLTFLQDQGLRVWTDREIKPGDVWRDKIKEALSRARVAVLLVSIHFLTSKFIQEEELPMLSAAAAQGLMILWVYVGSPNGQHSPVTLAQYQVTHDLTKPLKTITDPEDLAQVLTHISEQISHAVQQFQEKVPEQTTLASPPEWPSIILSYKGDPDFPAFESYRDELLPLGEPGLF